MIERFLTNLVVKKFIFTQDMLQKSSCDHYNDNGVRVRQFSDKGQIIY